MNNRRHIRPQRIASSLFTAVALTAAATYAHHNSSAHDANQVATIPGAGGDEQANRHAYVYIEQITATGEKIPVAAKQTATVGDAPRGNLDDGAADAGNAASYNSSSVEIDRGRHEIGYALRRKNHEPRDELRSRCSTGVDEHCGSQAQEPDIPLRTDRSRVSYGAQDRQRSTGV